MLHETLICLFPTRHQTVQLYQISCVRSLVSEIREFNQRKKKKKNEQFRKQFTPFPIVEMDPFFSNT